MFFAYPAASFANIASGLRTVGRLVFVCCPNLADNEWIVVPGAATARRVALPPLDDPTGPGPFSLGLRDRIAPVLGAAQLTDVTLEPVAEPLWIGPDVADTVAFLNATGIGKSLLRDAALEPYVSRDGVRLGSRAWLVTPHRPG